MKNLFDDSKCVTRLQEDFGRLLMGIATETSARYAFECVKFDEGCIVVTDGRKLLRVDVEHGQQPGLYHITPDGYLVKLSEDAPQRFPDSCGECIPVAGDMKKLNLNWGLPSEGSPILFELSKAGVYVKVSWVLSLEKCLLELHLTDWALFVHTKKPKEHAFMLTGRFGITSEDVSFVYVQMPLMQPTM